MISSNDDWTASMSESSELSDLNGCLVAIEAADYLSKILTDDSFKEPLLPALGGLPFALKKPVQADIARWKSNGITPFFVFPGLQFDKKEEAFRASDEAARIHSDAWDLYNQSEAQRAVATFGEACTVRTDDLHRYFQSILRDAGVDFIIAPYSAWAQLAYLSRSHDFHAVAGSSEILLFDVDRIITSWNFEQDTFTWIQKRKCMTDLGNLPPEQFVDACLLSGTSLLPPLPILESAPRRKQAKIKNAVDLMLQFGRSGMAVCQQYQDDPKVRAMNYADRYMRSRMAVQHHVILTIDGQIKILNVENAPGDIHNFIGQRLPDEIYYYLAKGVIGPRILNYRASCEIVELAPIDGGESQDYRNLVRDQLTPLRATSILLLSQSLARFYQHKDVTLECWFDRGSKKMIAMKEVADPKPMVANWNVKSAVIEEKSKVFQTSGILGFTLQSLKDTEFAKKTIATKDLSKLLSTKSEILTNSVWRFLQLREYVDSKHNLTQWGEALFTAISALKGQKELEEPVFLAIELARLNLLSSRQMFPSYGGPPLRDADKRNNLLVSRLACLAKLRHNPIGFTGPLSRHLLGYGSIIAAVRNCLRDLAEVSLTTLLLNGDSDRESSDLTELGLELPFLLPIDCALGIAVKTYLDDILTQPDSTAPEVKAESKTKAASLYFPEATDLVADLDKAFLLWDAVYAGLKAAGKVFQERALWDEVDVWLAPRR